MNHAPTATALSAARSSWVGRNIHFLAAAAVLAGATGWWWFAKDYLGWALSKEAVPWPQGVQVTEDFRLASLPKVIGPYRLEGSAPDESDGEQVFRPDELETLGVGTSWDRTRYDSRRCNWYLSRIYRDTRLRGAGEPYSRWQLFLTYYTGAMDTVPHVPDVCLVQGGNELLGTETVMFRVPAARNPWDRQLKVNRTRYKVMPAGQPFGEVYSQYYVFSLNGSPEHDWKIVRAHLANPLVRYCYFAKVQFVPLNPAQDSAEADRKAQEFLGAILPSVLVALPSGEEVARCASAP